MEGLEHEFGLGAGTRAPALWAELAQAGGQPASAAGAALGRSLGVQAAGVLARVFSGLFDLVGIEPAAQQYLPRLDELVRAVPRAVLTGALQQLEVTERRRLASDACDHLSANALAALLLAAAPSYGQSVSPVFGELLAKLGTAAVTGPEAERVRADTSFRSLVRHVFERWSSAQVSAGTSGYEALFQPSMQPRTRTPVTPLPNRVVQLALETGGIGPMLWAALAEQIGTDAGMRELMDMLKQAPPSLARDTIAEQLATPARLMQLLREEPIDWSAADTLLPHLGLNAVRPLLDALVESPSRATRRAIMDRLVQLGPEIQPAVLERIGDARWYVVRNMLSLLREAGCSLEKVPLEHFANHQDARVRRETLQLRLEDPALRDQALAEALIDPDKSVLRAALQAARQNLPPTAVAILAQRVLDPTFPAEFRVLSLYLLGRSGQPVALDTLLRFVHGGKSLLGRVRLATRTPEMLAALSGLARSFSSDRRARELLDVAARSGEEQVLNALRAVRGGEEH